MAPRLLGWKAPVDFVVVCRERAKLTIVFQAGSWGDAAGLEEGGGEVECPGALPALQPSCLPSSQARGKARRRRRERQAWGVLPAAACRPGSCRSPLSAGSWQAPRNSSLLPLKEAWGFVLFYGEFFSEEKGKKKRVKKEKIIFCFSSIYRGRREGFWKWVFFSQEGISVIQPALPYAYYTRNIHIHVCIIFFHSPYIVKSTAREINAPVWRRPAEEHHWPNCPAKPLCCLYHQHSIKSPGISVPLPITEQ